MSIVKQGGGSVMMWRCLGVERPGDLLPVMGIMRKVQYHTILQRHNIPSCLRIITKK